MRSNPNRLRALRALIGNGYWELDDALQFSVIDGRDAGFAPTMLGRHPWDCLRPDPNSKGWSEYLDCLHAHRSFRDLEFSQCDAAGVAELISVSGQPVQDDQGRFRDMSAYPAISLNGGAPSRLARRSQSAIVSPPNVHKTALSIATSSPANIS